MSLYEPVYLPNIPEHIQDLIWLYNFRYHLDLDAQDAFDWYVNEESEGKIQFGLSTGKYYLYSPDEVYNLSMLNNLDIDDILKLISTVDIKGNAAPRVSELITKLVAAKTPETPSGQPILEADLPEETDLSEEPPL